MSRALWFVAGAGVSVYAMNKARRVQESFTVEGLKDRAKGLAVGARLFREEVAQGQVEKETELRERLGLVPTGVSELESPDSTRGRHRAVPAPSPTAGTGSEPGTSSNDTLQQRHPNKQEGTT